jgi:uncharacterized protein with HEPN domain
MYSDKNLIYIFTILESIEKIKIYTDSFCDEEEFYYANEQMNFNAVVSLLIAIGEESKKIDQQIKDDYDFLWNSVSKMRDKISHNYRGINPYMVWEIVQNSLQNYKEVLLMILPDIDEFDLALKDALNSKFYTHLGYLNKKRDND